MFRTASRALMSLVGPAMTPVPVSKAAWIPWAPQMFSLAESTAMSLRVTCHSPVSVLESGCQTMYSELMRLSEAAPNVTSESSSSPSLASHTAKRLLSRAPALAKLPRKLKFAARDAPCKPRPNIPSYGSKLNGSSDISAASTRPALVQSSPPRPRQTVSCTGRPVRLPVPTDSLTASPSALESAPSALELVPAASDTSSMVALEAAS
mmetsp:Transcript_92015/g.286846  ORF Transcript_92015/g.286846 Transcript_92015/m.286846 type:complete len:208 (-) Transcript_92015:76-699(-)